jgi:23S rRNA (pseudouridine1915-N3)-methyltransferase
MKARIVSRSRLREPSLQERFTYYQKLLRKRLPVELLQAKKSGTLPLIPKRSRVIALDEHGTALTSRELAERLSSFERENISYLAFIIGEADGLTTDERNAADELWSLSNLTLPHQMCMVLLVEQLYRATAINRGEPYHRE